MTIAAGNKILLSDLAPLETFLASNLTTIPTAAFASIGIGRTVTSPGTASVWEVTVEVDYQQASASTVEVILAANGTQQTGEMVFFGLAVNFRAPFSHTWRVTGITAGTLNLDAQIKSTVANSCALYANNTHLIVRQVA